MNSNREGTGTMLKPYHYSLMKKLILTAAIAALALPALAGGLLTNTNQNAAFLRNMAQDAQLTLTSIYANPAGNVFLSEGWHLSLNSQTAFQQRNIDTTFPLFAMNVNNRELTHYFEGEAKAPIIPSVSVSYNKERWSVLAHFALTGGGGKCEFAEGLGSFESLVGGMFAQNMSKVQGLLAQGIGAQVAQSYIQAGIPAEQATEMGTQIGSTTAITGYSMDSYLRGRSYYFGLTVGGAYKFLDNFSGFFGLRGIYASCNYNGYVQDVKAHYNVPANAQLQFPGVQGEQSLNTDLALNCNQTGFGITPIIGLDWKINEQWNLAMKYEAPTKINLKNDSEMNETAAALAQDPTSPLAQFRDGEKVREDIPAILTAGVMYTPIEQVRINAGWHYYFDKQAKKYGDKQDLLKKGSQEFNVGIDWRFHRLFTVSASWQNTSYRMEDAYMNDISFNLPSNSFGCGFRIHPSKYFNVDLGYMHTFYRDREVTTQTAAGPKVDLYSRTNDCFGIGFNIYL